MELASRAEPVRFGPVHEVDTTVAFDVSAALEFLGTALALQRAPA
jgi:hypothetical protein